VTYWLNPELVDLIRATDGTELCRSNPEDWFPGPSNEEGAQQASRFAKEACSYCHLMAECAAYALAHPEETGIWGGTTERDREKLRKRRRAA